MLTGLPSRTGVRLPAPPQPILKSSQSAFKSTLAFLFGVIFTPRSACSAAECLIEALPHALYTYSIGVYTCPRDESLFRHAYQEAPASSALNGLYYPLPLSLFFCADTDLHQHRLHNRACLNGKYHAE